MSAEPGTRGALVAVVALALAVRLLNLHLLVRLPTVTGQTRWREADMALAYEWSGRILDGDVLGRDTPHQYTTWMQDIAPLETWERWWGGRTIFHQAPLYAYVLAGMRLAVGDGMWRLDVCQAVLGAADVALTFLLAARVFGVMAATVAGVGAALYGPFLLYEVFLLRDNVGVTTSLLLLWWLAGCAAAKAWRWLVGGILLALSILAREGTILFVPLVLLWVVRRLRAEPRALARAAGALLAGLALGLAPLVARNVLVGAPPLALSTRGIEAFIHGNAADAPVIVLALPAATRSILAQADGDLLRAVRFTLETYHGNWHALLAKELFKLRAILAAHEGADNVSWYYYADHSALLRHALRFEHVLALGLLGLWVAPRDAGGERLLRYFFVAVLLGLMYGAVMGRYRLPAAAVLLAYAGAAGQWVASAWRVRRWRALALAAVAVVGAVTVSQHLLGGADRLYRDRPDEYFLTARAYYEGGARERAFDEARTGLEHAYAGPDQQALPRLYITLLAEPFVRVAHELGRDRDAAAELEALAAAYPADAALQELLGVVYRDGLARPEEAARHFEAAARLARP